MLLYLSVKAYLATDFACRILGRMHVYISLACNHRINQVRKILTQ